VSFTGIRDTGGSDADGVQAEIDLLKNLHVSAKAPRRLRAPARCGLRKC
jgi:hypothetical protein